MTKKGENTKPANPKPKNYADYLQDLVSKGEMTQKEKDIYVDNAKRGYAFYDKRTYLNCR